MASVQIPNLPVAIGLNGTEELEIVQGGTSCRTTTQAIANLGVGSNYGAHGAFHSTAIQTNPVASAVNKITYNVITLSDGVTVLNNSRISVSYAGIYNLQFSAQLEKTDGGTDNVDIWIQINGNNVDYTNTRIELQGSNAKQIAAWNFVIQMAANQYVELCWSSADSNARLYAEGPNTGPARPGIPSVIATMTLVKPL